MKWIACAFLIIVFDKISVGQLDVVEGLWPEHNLVASVVQKSKSIFMLGTDGFMGYLLTAQCNGTAESIRCQSNQTANSSNIFVFSFNASNSSTSVFTGRTGDVSVSFTTNLPIQLNISRNSMPDYICFFNGKCSNNSWASWISKGCNSKESNYTAQNCSINCFDPTNACGRAQYNPNCKGDPGNENSFTVNETTESCWKCGSPFQSTEPIVPPAAISNSFQKNASVSASTAASVMANLSSLVNLMGNLTIASITMGNVEGVLKVMKSASDVTTSAYIYSPQTGVQFVQDLAVLSDYPNAIIVPKEAGLKALNQSNSGVFLGVFRFPNMTEQSNSTPVLNDEVYAIEMGSLISNLTVPINLTFTNGKDGSTPVCNSWDGSGQSPNWTTDGCDTTIVGTTIVCKCTHLTFFAVLMAPTNITISQNDLNTLTYISNIGCGLSLFFLGVGLFMHFLLRKRKVSSSVHVLMNLFSALFLLDLAFLSNSYVAEAKNATACMIMAGFMHYCLLTSFTWFAVEAIHLCLQMTRHSRQIQNYILKVSVIGWVPSGFIVIIIFIFGKYGEQTIQTDTGNKITMCWIPDSNVHYIVNIGYYSFIFVVTFSTFIVVLRWLSLLKVVWLKSSGKISKSKTENSDICTILGLCCLLGLTWGFAFFSYGALQIPSFYIFSILNSFQGFFLFVYYLKTSGFIGDGQVSENSDSSVSTKTINPYDMDSQDSTSDRKPT